MFLTLLACDEVDNPFRLAVKCGVDGVFFACHCTFVGGTFYCVSVHHAPFGFTVLEAGVVVVVAAAVVVVIAKSTVSGGGVGRSR